jgi:hypothetical protein
MSNKSTSTPKSIDDKMKKNIGVGVYIGSMIVSALAVFIYFGFGSIFLNYINFYKIYKMNGRDLNGPPYTANQQGRGWDFPYKNMFTTSQSKGLITRFMKWLTFSIAYSFANSRSYLDKFLDLTGEFVSKMPKFIPSIVIIFSPLIMVGMVIASFFSGSIGTLVGSLLNFTLVIPSALELIVMILAFCIPLLIYPALIFSSAFGTAGVVGIIQAIMLVGMFIIIPLTNQKTRNDVFNTIMDNKTLMMICIFLFSTINSFVTLDSTYGYISLGFTLAAMLWYIFTKFF